MKSIRTRLLVRLSLVMGVLFIASGAAIYSVVRTGMIGNIDDELRLASIVAKEILSQERKTTRPAKTDRNSKRWTEFKEEGSGLYYQAWNMQQEVVARSESLGDFILPHPKNIDRNDYFFTMDLPNGHHVRAMFSAVNPQPKHPNPALDKSEKPKFLVVAKELSEIQRTLSLLLGGIGACGVFVAICGWLMIGRGLRLGLEPLSLLGEKATTIHAESLASRFDESTLPEELLPIGRRLNDLMARLEQGFERERRFSADLAHEMRTPIAELRAVAETALRWPEQSEPTDFNGILETTRRMQSLVEKLLALARWESNPSVDEQEILIPALLNECWQPLEKSAASRGVKLKRKLPPDLVWHTDVGMLRPIFENLLSNAAEYAPDNDTIELIADSEGLSISNAAGRLNVEQVPLLFDRCWRLDPSRSGTSHFGLGLPLAKACAVALGYTLTAKMDFGMLQFNLTKTGKSP